MGIYIQRLEHLFMRISQTNASDPVLKRLSMMVTNANRILDTTRRWAARMLGICLCTSHTKSLTVFGLPFDYELHLIFLVSSLLNWTYNTHQFRSSFMRCWNALPVASETIYISPSGSISCARDRFSIHFHSFDIFFLLLLLARNIRSSDSSLLAFEPLLKLWTLCHGLWAVLRLFNGHTFHKHEYGWTRNEGGRGKIIYEVGGMMERVFQECLLWKGMDEMHIGSRHLRKAANKNQQNSFLFWSFFLAELDGWMGAWWGSKKQEYVRWGRRAKAFSFWARLIAGCWPGLSYSIDGT